MAILQGLLCLLLLLPALAMGALWVRRVLGSADAHTALTLGAVAGLSAHITALNALAYLILPGHAALALALTEGLAAVLLWRGLAAQGRPVFDCGRCAAVARGVWPWVGLIAALWSWTILHTGSSDQLFHASVCAPMARSGLPATHPFDTTQVLNYHYALNILGASLGACTGLKSWWALDVALALLAPMILAGCVEFLRAAAAADGREATRAELLFGTLLFALGGNFQWIEWLQGKADANPANRFGFGCDGIATLFPAPAQAGAWVWLFAVFAFVLRWRAGVDTKREAWADGAGPGRGCWSASIPLGFMLGVLCLTAEHAAFAVAIALVVFTAWDLRGGLERVSSLLIAGALGLGLAVVQGGTITGLALKLSGSGNLKPGWTGDAWPSFPSQLGRVTHADPGYCSFIWREYGATLYLMPLLLAWGLSRRAPTAVRWLLVATVPCAFVTLYVRFPLNEFDTYRFYQLYLCAALLAVGLFCARLWEARPALPWKLAALLVCAPLCVEGTRATAVWALTFYPNSPWDYPAAQHEAYAEVERRIAALGPNPDPTETRVIAQLPGLNFAGIPTEPGITGRAVPAGDPDTDVTIVRGRAWWNALQCPSPPNLRTARARWVLLNGEDLARARPILEGCPDFVFIGAYGPDDPGERYRLYHYTGGWEAQDNEWWQVRKVEPAAR